MSWLKIMSEHKEIPKNPFGVVDLLDRLKAFCREHKLAPPRFWIFPPDGCYIFHAVSLQLKDRDKLGGINTTVIFVLKDFSLRKNREMEANRFRCMFKDFGEPIVMTSKIAKSPINQQLFYKSVGLIKIPVTWSDNKQNEYEVYTKGKLEMGSFVTLMEQIEHIGIEIVYK